MTLYIVMHPRVLWPHTTRPTRFFIAPVGSRTHRVRYQIRGERIYIIHVRDTRQRDT